MTGIALTERRRSQLLEALLAQQAQRPEIQSGGELAARLGAQALRQRKINDLRGQEDASNQALVDALNTGQATAPQSFQLETITGEAPNDPTVIPGKKADPFAQAAAISELPIEQQIQVAQLQALRNELSGGNDTFTLSPGQTRFTGNRQVASIPADTPKRTKAGFIDADTGQAHAGSFDGEFYRTSAGDVIRNASPIAPAAGQKDIQNNTQAFRPIEA